MSAVVAAPGPVVAASPPRIFGFVVSRLDAEAIAERIATTLRQPAGAGHAGPDDGRGVGLVVTPNIDHVRLLRHDADFAAAYASAAIITCDGFPVFRYARLRGCAPAGRVTGVDLARALLRHPALGRHRVFFAADSDATADGLRRWAARRGMDGQVATHVPPHGFERDPAASGALVDAIAAHGTTLLLMGVGAPRSEAFVHGHRARLPPCWALCVGQALRIEAGVIRRAPSVLAASGTEWLWRLAHEPRRLSSRYAAGSVGFLRAIAADLRKQG
ncbi:MAG: WecB/TagA/CpsF family glycosyltransferase [Janthinobacterium lividum]